jgi:hemolysin III
VPRRPGLAMTSPILLEELVRPRLRGLFHLYGFVLFAALGPVLVATAPGWRERLAAIVFCGCLLLSFGLSALYHRVSWQPTARLLMRRLDHAGVFALIAGSYVPYGLLVLVGAWRFSVLSVVGLGAIAGIVLRVVWAEAPTWMSAVIAIALGWVALVVLPQVVTAIGWPAVALLLAGGALYTLGAVAYAARRPNPLPAVFGYHEIFHLLTVFAAACHFCAIALYLLPGNTG